MRTLWLFVTGVVCSMLPVAAAQETIIAAVPPVLTYSTAETIEMSPAREYAKVRFTNPVRIGENVLMGDYIIEHDTDRMARGGPCTHIYAAKNRTTPVVAFHCRHLLRPVNKSAKTLVTLRRDYNSAGHGYILTEFQYAHSREAHGVPRVPGVPAVR